MTELEKLTNAAALIEEMTEGRQALRIGVGGGYIANTDDANFGMQMRIRSGSDPEHYRITFDAFVRRMGVTMDSSSVMALMEEAGQIHALLTALEVQAFHPTALEFQQFLTDTQQREQPEQQSGFVMEPQF